MEENLYNSGLNRTDWYQLRNTILDAVYHKGPEECQSYVELPEHLKSHAAGRFIRSALYEGNRSALDKAAKAMVGGASKAWLILEKS